MFTQVLSGIITGGTAAGLYGLAYLWDMIPSYWSLLIIGEDSDFDANKPYSGSFDNATIDWNQKYIQIKTMIY